MEKEKEILKEGMQVENIPEVLSKSILEVRLKTGKGAFKTSVSSNYLAIKVKSDESKEFMKNHFDPASFYFFPREVETRLNNISGKTRRMLERKSIANGIHGSYINKDSYEEIVEESNKSRDDFFAERQKLLDNHSMYLTSFKKDVDKVLEEIGTEDRETVLKILVSKFPTKEEITRNFYFELISKPYSIFSEELKEVYGEKLYNDTKEGHKQDAIDTFYSIVGNTLNNLFEKVASSLDTFSKNNSIPNKTKGGITNALSLAERDNKIVKSDKVSMFIDIIKRTIVNGCSLKTDDGSLKPITDGELEETAELILANIYGYSNYIGIQNQIKIPKECGYSADDLLEIYNFSSPIDDMVEKEEA